MKFASLVVGPHFSGKSITIREYLKPKLGMTKGQRKFRLNNKNGYILSQSLEESGKDIGQIIRDYCDYYQLLVFAARPRTEDGSKLSELESNLSAKGFQVQTVNITLASTELDYEKTSLAVYKFFSQQ